MTSPVWTPAPPPPAAEPVDSTRVKGAIAAALVVVGAIALLAVMPSKSWYPSHWDPRIAPIAAKVSDARGLDFVHPVQVHFLPQDQFNKLLVGDGSVSASDHAEFATEAGVLRALGLISGTDDLAQASKDQAESDVAAFYSNRAKEVFVNGTTFDVEHRVTVAHELTHVLQDQHFDLSKLDARAVASDTGDTEALTSLVEGDAVRIQDEFLKSLSAADKREYTREAQAASAGAAKGGADVPAILTFMFEAPYEFGPATARILFDSGGNLAVDDALIGPTPGARILLEPAELDAPSAVDAPDVPQAATRISHAHQQSFSTFQLYPMLATKLSPAAALHAADLVDGAHSVTYSSNGKICEAVNFLPRLRQTAPLASALRQWASGRAGTRVAVQNDLVQLTACDPGKSVPEPSSARLRAAAAFLEARTEFTEGLALGKVPPAPARCVARVLMSTPALARVVLGSVNRAPTASETAEIRNAATPIIAECRRDSNAGLH